MISLEHFLEHLKRNDPPKRFTLWRIGLWAGRLRPDLVAKAYAAADLATVGTDAIVFRIWEAIW